MKSRGKFLAAAFDVFMGEYNIRQQSEDEEQDRSTGWERSHRDWQVVIEVVGANRSYILQYHSKNIRIAVES